MTQTKPRLLLIGAHDALCDRARLRDIDFLLVEHPARSDGLLNKRLRQVLLTDYETDNRLLPMLKATHEQQPFLSVISLTEAGLEPAARIGNALGLPVTAPETVTRMRDKWHMRQHLEQHCFPSLKARIAKTPKDLENFIDIVGLPVILKPKDGRASRDVRLIKEYCDIQPAMAVAPSVGFLVEQFAHGPEYSVETFSFAGKHCLLAITEKMIAHTNATNPFVETGHVIPARLPTTQEKDIADFICRFLDIIGLRDGPAHTEIKLTPTGPHIIETHNRIGGDCIVDLVRLATDHDILQYAIDWPCELMAPLEDHAQPRRGAAIRYFTPPPGRVESITGVETARRQPGIADLHLTIKPGDIVSPVKASGDRVGYVIACAPTGEEAAQLCDDTIKAVRIDVSPL